MPGDRREQCVDAGSGIRGVERCVVELRCGHVKGVLGDHPDGGRPYLVQHVVAADDGTDAIGVDRGDTDAGEFRRQPGDLGRRARRQTQQQRPAPVADPSSRQLLHEVQGGAGGTRLAQRRGRARRHRQSGYHWEPEGHQPVHGDAVRAQFTGVQPSDPSLAVGHQGVAGGVRLCECAGVAVGDAQPRLLVTSSSSSASSCARLIPRTSSSSWCSRIHTVWYESHRGEASHSTAPSSKRSRASSRSVT